MKFLQVMISSELRTQALRLLEHLIRKSLISGDDQHNLASCLNREEAFYRSKNAVNFSPKRQPRARWF